MNPLRLAFRAALALNVVAATIASASVAETDVSHLVTSASGGVVKDLKLGVGQSQIVDLPKEAAEIYVGDPRIANAIVRSASRIYVSAIANGQTTIFALGRDGQKVETIEVSVGRDVVVRDVRELSNLLNVAIPGNDIHVRTVEDSIILTGSVASAEEAQKAMDIASGFVAGAAAPSSGAASVSTTSSGGSAGSQRSVEKVINSNSKVINSLIIRGLDQVSVKVTVAEIRRDISKQLGVNMIGSGPNGSITLDNPFAINGALSATQATLNWFRGSGSFSATLRAFEREGVAHTLAEPTVTAVSGESAKFMAGGTIPILTSVQCSPTCVYGITQQPYGVTLNFTPVVLSEGRIQLRIATEVTDVDYSKQIAFGGFSTPGFRTRNNVTTVELPSGGSIASAGLISTQSEQAINGLPALMNLPVLGALFRSRDYQRNETELMIIVTPYIVHAIDPSQVVRPDQNFEDSSDPQAVLLGRVNRIYSTSGSLRPLPGYAGKIGFITQ
jgi:pilus assembly protein CpaC